MEETSMASAAVDHMISLTIFMAAILIFIGLFSQTMQTGIAYELHSALSTKTSDLLDTILLNPGLPVNWSQRDDAIVGFGLQNPDFSQYKLSSLSPMRLNSFAQSPVYYPRTGAYYSNNSVGVGSCLLASSAKSFNYSTVSKMLGINGTYGFQFTISPTITVLIDKASTGAPLKLSVNAAGPGYPLANAPLSYCLILVNQDANNYPSYSMISGVAVTDAAGFAQLPPFQGIDGESQSYALIVYSYLSGLKGMGYYVHELPSFTKTIVPLIDSFQNRTITITHGDSVGQPPQTPSYSLLSYNASFVLLTEEYTLRQVALDQSSAVGKVFYDSNNAQNYSSVNLPNNDGILIVTYKGTSAGQYGLVLMPWGLSSLGLPLTFGGNPTGQEWVTTDIRQVTVGSISYQAKLELWNLQGYKGVR
jgi:hypothetical protein